MKIHQLPVDDVLATLHSGIGGLSRREAERRLIDGPNRIEVVNSHRRDGKVIGSEFKASMCPQAVRRNPEERGPPRADRSDDPPSLEAPAEACGRTHKFDFL